MITNQLQGIQATLLKPMLTNYLTLLTQQSTNQSAVQICQTLREKIDYVEYGDGVFRDNSVIFKEDEFFTGIISPRSGT